MTSRRTTLALLGSVALIGALGVAACGGSDDSKTTAGGGTDTASGGGGGGGGTFLFTDGTPAKGGTYRIGVPDLGFTGGFDPSGEYLGWAWGLHQQLMTRGLVGYRHVEGVAGTEPMPDLAEALPTGEKDNTVWTFKLKKGVKFAPPLNREVTSKDVAYAFERMATKSVGAQYANYFYPIKGFQEMLDGKAKTIEGIATPDDQTITFTLKEPTADFLFRMAMPAAAPIPQEIAKCFPKAGEYGRYVVGTGPYMIEGTDKLNISSCDAMKPIAGFSPTDGMTFVRNPNYDPETDDPAQRSALPDSFEIIVNTNEKDVYDKIQAGELEDSAGLPVPPEIAREYATGDEAKKARFQAHPEDSTSYITMNLTVPPFDDIHVRKAVNWVMDKNALRLAWGGELYGSLTGHTIPSVLLGGKNDIDPYATPDSAGDVNKAMEEMKQSAYDTNKDGKCDKGCDGVLYLNRNYGPYAKMTPIVRDALSKIGINVDVKALPTGPAYTTLQTTKNLVPIASNARWGKDYPDASTFAVLFDGRNILATGNTNYALVGLTPEKAKEIGIAAPATPVPSVDADIDACNKLSGQERIDCWVKFDEKVMTEVVPWVPYMNALNTHVLGPAVTQWDFDQDTGEAALAHVAVDPAKQKK